MLSCRPEMAVSVGDFGYWPRHAEGRRFLEIVTKSAKAAGTSVHFIDGNHEEHDSLRRDSTDGFEEVAPNIHYIPRGTRWQWGHVWLAGMGGAVSPDRSTRTRDWDWFPEEAITDEDIERLGYERVDILVAHDAPTSVDLGAPISLEPDVALDALANRMRLDRAVRATQPSLVVHGHWHVAHQTPFHEVTCEGLAVGLASDPMDDLPSVTALIDLERFVLRTPGSVAKQL